MQYTQEEKAEDEKHFQELRGTFLEWQQFLDSDREPRAAQLFMEQYHSLVDNRFAYLKGNRKPAYDENSYPSLFHKLAIFGDAQFDDAKVPVWDALPETWDPEEINKALGTSSLARLLLAFIWKQGDYPTVKHVLNGLKGRPQPEGASAVMHQFGQHLKAPLENPIFDQHTSRQKLLLDKNGIEGCKNVAEFRNLFGDDGIPINDQKLNGSEYCRCYLDWWNERIYVLMPKLDKNKPGERAKAILWSDRIMFSLGMAAKGVYAWKPRAKAVKT